MYWAPFDARFGFRAGVQERAWPGIREPTPSLTVDLSLIFMSDACYAAGVSAINALALWAFVQLTSVDEELVVLDWQHPSYRFSPHRQVMSDVEWPVTVFPDGDYYVFLNEAFTMGTFGHPWEQTLCVFGEDLIELLGEPLARAFGEKRRN